MYQRALDGYYEILDAENSSISTILLDLGTLYKKQAKPSKAENIYQRVLQACEKTVGAEHEKTIARFVSLGLIYAKQGKTSVARKMYQRALHKCEKQYGAGDMSRWPLSIARELVILSFKQGKTEALYQRLLKLYEDLFGVDHTNTLIKMKEFAMFYREHGKLVEAEKMYQRALQKIDGTLGTEHILTRSVVKDLRELYFQ